MIGVPLTLGPLKADGFAVSRSGVRWLREDGHICRANEIIGFCNIALERVGGFRPGSQPFADERELQVAFAPRVGGRLQIVNNSSLGGYLDIVGAHGWDPETVIAHIEPVAGSDPSSDSNASALRLLMLAGRRMSDLADVHSGLLPGWHRRARAWWGDGSGDMSTLLSLGLCDATSVVKGSQSAFTEMFEATSDPMHVVYVPDHPIVPCAPVLTSQLIRTDEQYEAIVTDMMRGLTNRGQVPAADDLLFAGAFLSAFRQSPIRDAYDVLTPGGLRKLGPANAILLSLSAEGGAMLRHKNLGYEILILQHHQSAAGPAVRAWLRSAFEPFKRTVDDIRRDYLRLLDAIGEATGAHILIMNRMSTSGHEDITNYASFDHPMSETLANIASKELNLMLYDLAERRDCSIVDLDAIAAELGGSEHLPDGIHQSGTMSSVMRAEILHLLATLSAK